jgi:hypothetical protein
MWKKGVHYCEVGKGEDFKHKLSIIQREVWEHRQD